MGFEAEAVGVSSMGLASVPMAPGNTAFDVAIIVLVSSDRQDKGEVLYSTSSSVLEILVASLGVGFSVITLDVK